MRNEDAPRERQDSPTLLHKGDIVAFSIAPLTTAAQYGSPLLPSALQQLSFKKYLGIIIMARRKANPVQASGDTPGALQEIEHLRLLPIGRMPPEDPNWDDWGGEDIKPLLPGGSAAFASLPLTQQPLEEEAEAPTPERPLIIAGNKYFPFTTSFVHTLDVIEAYMDMLHGPVLSSLAAPDVTRLTKVRNSHDASVTQAKKAMAAITYRSLKPIEVSLHEVCDDEESIDLSGIPGMYFPAVDECIVDVWTDFTDLGDIGEPSEYWNELAAVQKAVEECYKSMPPTVEGWVNAVDADSEKPHKHEEMPKDISEPGLFSFGLVLGIGLGVLGSYVFRLYRQHR